MSQISKKKFSLTIDREKRRIWVCLFGKNLKMRYNYRRVDIVNKLLICVGVSKDNRLKVTRHFDKNCNRAYQLKFHKFSIEEVQELFNVYKIFPKNILSIEETINYIVDNKISVARLGDEEELNAMLALTPKYPELKSKLINICASGSNEHCFVCINNFNADKDDLPFFFRRAFGLLYSSLKRRTFERIQFNDKTNYGDAYAFLFYYYKCTEAEKNIKHSKIKKIWENRKVLFIVNSKSNILTDTSCFNNTKEKAFIFGPAQNAFSEYDKILNEIKNNYDTSWLVYIEMGAMATVLSYELSEIGFQALDMGHYYSRAYIHKMPA